jgi:hypothetical protein
MTREKKLIDLFHERINSVPGAEREQLRNDLASNILWRAVGYIESGAENELSSGAARSECSRILDYMIRSLEQPTAKQPKEMETV